jgi:hypothetical protein
MSIRHRHRHRLRPMLRTHPALPLRVSYGTFLARPVRRFHPRLLQFTIQAPISVEDFWTLRCEMSEKIREKVAMLSREQLTEVRRQSLEALRGYSTDRGDEFSG